MNVVLLVYVSMAFLFAFLFIAKRGGDGKPYSPLRKQHETGAEFMSKLIAFSLLWPAVILLLWPALILFLIGGFIRVVGKWLRETPEYYE